MAICVSYYYKNNNNKNNNNKIIKKNIRMGVIWTVTTGVHKRFYGLGKQAMEVAGLVNEENNSGLCGQ